MIRQKPTKIVEMVRRKRIDPQSREFPPQLRPLLALRHSLLNSATTSWFVAVEKNQRQAAGRQCQDRLGACKHQRRRFGKWLEGARDWAISRNRYWGTPLPIWRNRHTGEIEVIGSRDELMMKAPGRFTKITIARHAQSKGNVDRIYQGKVPGTKLTPEGKKQAKALADSVYSEQLPIQTIYHSPLMHYNRNSPGCGG